MRWKMGLRILVSGLALAGLAVPAMAASLALAPYKDDLFAYPKILESRDGGDFITVDYQELRDINGRDEIPERKVRWEYVSLGTKRVEGYFSYTSAGRTLKYAGTGATSGPAKAIVIYLHGQNGTRFQGADDWTFGGNFNRIKNLMVAAGGVYLSPDFSDFEATGENEIKSLMKEYAARSPGAPIFVACGSYGGKLCWALARDPDAASLLSGLLLLGSLHDDGFLKTGAMKPKGRRIPIFIGHGGNDPIINWRTQAAFYEAVRKRVKGYPIRFVLFNTGNHGTPIRMTDWRATLNWMLASAGK